MKNLYLKIFSLFAIIIFFSFACSQVKRGDMGVAYQGIHEKDSINNIPIDSIEIVAKRDSLLTKIDTLSISNSDSITIADDTIKDISLNTLSNIDTATAIDSLTLPIDSLKRDSIFRSRETLTDPVFLKAKDSIVFVLNPSMKGYLYGDSEVKYDVLNIKGPEISMDAATNTVHATFKTDSTGKMIEHPVFTDKDNTSYNMKELKYNFETEKAFITNLITQQGEGYIVADHSKKNKDGSYFTKDARYTTCDHHDHPHFYLCLTKAKIRPNENIVMGPSYLVVADVPLPLFLPFGYFPFTDSYSSGLIMPSYDINDYERGIGFRDGGYYFAINDHVDLTLLGQFYSMGTWGISAQSTYRKRYKYSGSFSFNYLKTITGEKVLPDYSVANNLSIRWSHSQDPKANMYRTLSASVDFSTSSYSQNDLNQRYSRDAVNNTKGSSVNYTRRFPESPWNLSSSMTINQISRDSTISATLPNLSVSMSRIHPFKRKEAVGAEHWYEKISMSYSGSFRNSILTKENKFLKSNLIKDWKNGMQHSIPISASFKLFNNIDISPSFNYNEKWQTSKVREDWDPISKRHVVTDTTYGFYRIYDFNMSISMNTKLYGMYKPTKLLNTLTGNKIQAVRHIFAPSISLGYSPDFGDSKHGFFREYTYFDEQGNRARHRYSPYARGIFGGPSTGKSGSINFSFNNNIEMKINTPKDSIKSKKISLIDDLGINFSYNMLADSMRFSDIRTGLRLKLPQNKTINLTAVFDPYTYELDANGNPRAVDKLLLSRGKGIARLKSTGTQYGFTIDQNTYKKVLSFFSSKKRDKEDDNKDNSKNKDDDFGNEGSLDLPDSEDNKSGSQDSDDKKSLFGNNEESGEYDSFGYLKSPFEWSLSMDYSVDYMYGDFDKMRMHYKGKLNHSFGIRGNIKPTKNWHFDFNADYDMHLKRFVNLRCNLSRQLHCFEMVASFMALGPQTSYTFTIRAKSSLLSDLKWNQDERSSQVVKWYK